MDRQIEVADGGTLHQSAGDHDPACKGLGDEEYSHYEVDTKFLEGNSFCEEEVENGNGVYQPGEAGDETVDPFDVEDIFVFLQGHVEIDLLKFGRPLVFDIFFEPGSFPDRRNGSTDRVPFGDRKTGACQADKPPENHKKRYDGGKEEKPVHHGAVTVKQAARVFCVQNTGVLPVGLYHIVFSRNKVAGIIALEQIKNRHTKCVAAHPFILIAIASAIVDTVPHCEVPSKGSG